MNNKLALACAVLAAALASHAAAQGAQPEAAASTGDARERAQREGDKVFKWILMHADKPRKAREPVPAASTAVAATAPAREARTEAPKPPSLAARSDVPKAAARPVGNDGSAGASSTNDAAGSAALAALTPSPASKTPEPPEEAVEEPLMLTKQVDPEFPGALMRNLRKGTVQVKFAVQPDGSVADAQIVKTTHVRLNAAAIAAVQQWRFQPVRHAQLGIVELGFNLD